MSDASSTTSWILLAVLLVLVLVPGYSDRPALERPKKGFWRVEDIVYPIRRALRGLWPANPKLLASYRSALAEAWLVAGMSNLVARNFPGFVKTLPPIWLVLEGLVIGLFLGRAFGFWSADRKLQKQDGAEEPLKSVA